MLFGSRICFMSYIDILFDVPISFRIRFVDGSCDSGILRLRQSLYFEVIQPSATFGTLQQQAIRFRRPFSSSIFFQLTSQWPMCRQSQQAVPRITHKHVNTTNRSAEEPVPFPHTLRRYCPAAWMQKQRTLAERSRDWRMEEAEDAAIRWIGSRSHGPA